MFPAGTWRALRTESGSIDAMNAPRVRVMQPGDLAAVTAVERASYSAGWPATAFAHEIEHNRMARYLVLESEGAIAGFAGIWLMVDEAHVVTMAVAPGARRAGYGRLLLHGLVMMARAEGMLSATLEVRVSNEAARALYRRYGFYDVGERKKYYHDNGEDAVIMSTEEFATPAYEQRLARLGADLEGWWPGALAALADAIRFEGSATDEAG